MWSRTLFLSVLAACLTTSSAAEDLYEKGVALFQQGRLEEARVALAAALREKPDARTWKAFGTVHAAAGNYDVAEPAFAEACRLNEREEDACYYLARAQYARNRFEESLASLKKALPHDKRPWRSLLAMGQAEEALGRNADAEKHLRQATEARRSDSSPRTDVDPVPALSLFLFRQGRLEDARGVLEKGVKDNPKSALLWYQLGRVHYQSGDMEKALPSLQKAIAINPGMSEAHLLLGKLYTRTGRTAEAEQHLRLGGQGSVTVR